MTSAPSFVLNGSSVAYTAIVTNPHATDIPSVTLRTALAAAAQFAEATASQGQPAYDAASHSVITTIAPLGAGQTVVVTVFVRVSAPAGSQVAATTSAILDGFDCLSAATRVTIMPAGIPVTGVGPGPGELLVMRLVTVGGLGALLATGWMAARRTRRSR
jgi:hypothetical protein